MYSFDDIEFAELQRMHMKMCRLCMAPNIQTLYPHADLLAKYIYCYYFLEGTNSDFKNVHYSFPHTYNAITIYSNGSNQTEEEKIIINGNDSGSPFLILQGKRTKPLLVDLNGKFSRITIIFKPLGLNQFIDKPLGKLIGTAPQLFSEWRGRSYNQMLKNLFNDIAINQRIVFLEQFLLSILNPIALPEIEISLFHLSDFNNEKSINEVAALAGMSLRSFNRHFKLHIGISPASYRQIARFRHSLENKFFNDQFQKLITIAYQSNFSDQAHLNKLYKQLSGSNPKKLFQTVQQVGNTRLLFQFV